MLTSAAFCNPEAGLTALLSLGLPSATQCDIQGRGGSNIHLEGPICFHMNHAESLRHDAENSFNGSHSDVNASKDGSC